MWYCEGCDIEIKKKNKSCHIKTVRHQKNIGNNPYHHSKIYKIICNDTGKIYIGSTIRHKIEERLIEHKCNKKQYERDTIHSHICASYQLLDNCKIELIEEYNCDNSDELRIREQYHIENNECVNFIRAKGIGKSASDKEYREKNKERLKAFKGRKVICECGVTYTHNHASRHKRSKHHNDYIEKGIEFIQQQKEYVKLTKKEKKSACDKEYREKNKEKIKAHKGRVVMCECGVSHTHSHASRHKRSKHHINYMEQQI